MKDNNSQQNGSSVEILDGQETLQLKGDDGQIEEFFAVAIVEYDSEFFILLQPAKPIEGIQEDEAFIFRLQPEDETNDLYLPVTDEELAQKIFEEYLRAAK